MFFIIILFIPCNIHYILYTLYTIYIIYYLHVSSVPKPVLMFCNHQPPHACNSICIINYRFFAFIICTVVLCISYSLSVTVGGSK